MVESMLMEYQLGDIVKRQEGQIGFHEGLCAVTEAAGVGDDRREGGRAEAGGTEVADASTEAADTSTGPGEQPATKEGGSEAGAGPSTAADVGIPLEEQAVAAAATPIAPVMFKRPNIILRLSRECASSPSMLTEVSGVLSGVGRGEVGWGICPWEEVET